jgi:phage FluMu gp28-like protein
VEDYIYIIFKHDGVQYVFNGIIDEGKSDSYLLQYMCLRDAIRDIQYIWDGVTPYQVTLDVDIICYH